MHVREETAELVLAAIRLLERLAADVPELAGALAERRVRVAFDFAERVLLVSVVDDAGRGRALLAIDADPAHGDAFGDVGVPMPIAFDPHGPTH